MIALTALVATPVARAISALIGVLTLVLLVWIVAIKPRQELAAERTAHAQTKAEHAAVMADIAARTRAAAEAAQRARDTYTTKTQEDARVHELEVAAAFERGKGVAAGIRSGAVRVQDVWRDGRCETPDAGEGAGPGAGTEALTGGRADAIGRVLGYGGTWDADYAAIHARLTRAQALLNQCYEQPAQ